MNATQFQRLQEQLARLRLIKSRERLEALLHDAITEQLPYADFQEQLDARNTQIADVRVHGTTHERPLDRFAREREHLVNTVGHPSFLTDVRLSRLVATDYLVTFDTNRYSVPFHLIGQAVEVESKTEAIHIYHRGELVATHPRVSGRYQLSIYPEHGPGA